MTEHAREGLRTGTDGELRCWWCVGDDRYEAYHDEEWGRPVDDDRRLFEKLCLEGFQAGLSWLTILRKRPAFREVFDGFDPQRVAAFGEDDVLRLLDDSRIIRHRGKIEAAISNARVALDIIADHGSLARFVWQFEPDDAARAASLRLAGEPGDAETIDHSTVTELTQTTASRELALALKAHGWRFIGPTTAYAFMQSVGLVNDHVTGCVVRDEVDAARARFERPDRLD